MGKSKAQSSITAHRNPAYGSSRTVHPHPVPLFDLRHELPQEKVAVALPAVGGIDVETAESLRSNPHEIADLLLATEVIDQRPSTSFEECLLVVAEPVQEIEHRISIG